MSLDGQSVGQNGESLQRYITLSGLSGGRWAKQAAVAEKLIPHTAGASDRKDGQRQRSVAVGRSVGQSADISIQWSQEAGRHPRIHDPPRALASLREISLLFRASNPRDRTTQDA